jgi:2-iminoacetate synthase ThiH
MGVLVEAGAVNWDGGSVATATGTDTETGDTVVFAGDWRPMRDLASLLEEEGEIVCEVEEWQILRRTSAAA